jgi:hypothetical protein
MIMRAALIAALPFCPEVTLAPVGTQMPGAHDK